MATVERYVDPDVSGGSGDGTSWANAYSSLNAWEAAEQTDLVSDGDIHIVHCRASSGTADTTATAVDGWTTDADHYIKIVVDEADRHDGKWDTSAYRLEASAYGTLNINEADVILEGLQIGLSTTYKYGLYFHGAVSYNVTVDKCIIRSSDSASGQVALFCDDGTGGTINIYNTLVLDSGRFNVELNASSVTMNLYNCTCYNGHSYGIYEAAGTLNVKNTVSFNNTYNDIQVSNGTVDYCATDDGNGTNAVTPSDWSAVFVDYTNGDFHLKSTDTDLKDAGTDLSAYFTDDIDGDTRSGTWDIGADEYVSAGGLTISPTGFQSTASFGTPRFNMIVSATGFNQPVTFGTPLLNLVLTPAGFQVVTTFGAPRFNMVASPSGFVSMVTFGTPSLVTGLTVSPSGFQSAVTFGSPTFNITLQPSGFQVPVTFGQPNLKYDQDLSVTGFSVPVTFGSPIVSSGQTVSVSGFEQTVTFGSVSVYRGTEVLVCLYSDATAVPTTLISSFGKVLTDADEVVTTTISGKVRPGHKYRVVVEKGSGTLLKWLEDRYD